MLPIYIFFWKYSFYPFILTPTKYWLSLMLIKRKAAYIEVISELHDSMNWKNCRSFWNLQIWSKNSDFEPRNFNNSILPTIQFCPAQGLFETGYMCRRCRLVSVIDSRTWNEVTQRGGLPYLWWHLHLHCTKCSIKE